MYKVNISIHIHSHSDSQYECTVAWCRTICEILVWADSVFACVCVCVHACVCSSVLLTYALPPAVPNCSPQWLVLSFKVTGSFSALSLPLCLLSHFPSPPLSLFLCPCIFFNRIFFLFFIHPDFPLSFCPSLVFLSHISSSCLFSLWPLDGQAVLLIV